METGIYTITNLIDNKSIVGSGILKRRRNDHFYRLRNNKHPNPHLQASYNIHGPENFVWEVIEECEHILCPDIENWWINMLGTKDHSIGYNIETPGKGRIGQKLSQETKEKISKSNKGKGRPPGFTITEEHRKNLSIARNKRESGMLGKHHTEKTKEKIRQGNLGNQNALGHNHTEETRIKISLSKKGKPLSDKNFEHLANLKEINTGIERSQEFKDNLSKRMKGNTYTKGKKLSKEAKEHLSKLNKGKKLSEEAKQRMKEVWIKRKADKL